MEQDRRTAILSILLGVGEALGRASPYLVRPVDLSSRPNHITMYVPQGRAATEGLTLPPPQVPKIPAFGHPFPSVSGPRNSRCINLRLSVQRWPTR